MISFLKNDKGKIKYPAEMSNNSNNVNFSVIIVLPPLELDLLPSSVIYALRFASGVNDNCRAANLTPRAVNNK